MPTGKQNRDFEADIFDAGSLLDNAIEWIRKNMNITDVFDDDELEEWAESNGYKKE